MSISNPERVATKQDLKDFYDVIFPYLGGKVEAGFTPIGTIIAVMGNSAPTNYLACNGQVVNIADYPELANYFNAQFGSYNKFGGNGTTTFGIPDLRGEFLRGTGTNSHTNCGNGANVGTHQTPTFIPVIGGDSNADLYSYYPNNSSIYYSNEDSEKIVTTGRTRTFAKQTDTDATWSHSESYTTRPTNTSVLYCIATKNIYMNPALNYTTEEQVVGSWIDSKPVYQRVITKDSLSAVNTETFVSLGVTNVKRIVAFSNFYAFTDNNVFDPLYMIAKDYGWVSPYIDYNSHTLYLSYKSTLALKDLTFVIQYTKTTD